MNASWTCAEEETEEVIYLYRRWWRCKGNKAEIISSMFDFIFRAFYFLRWIYTNTHIRICHEREKHKKTNLEIKYRKKPNKLVKLYYFLEGGNEHYLCSTENNLFIYEIWTNTHETGTLLPELRLTCTFLRENFLFLSATITQVKRTKALKHAGRKPTNQYINNYTKIIS